MAEKVRVLRVMEYVGDREWIENTLKKGNMPADGVKCFGDRVIKSCLIDKFPEVFKEK
ncbi:TPA: hypothetical protein PTV74_003234 [Clostridium botulinum]|nr:hypothetical protein [Clostridium botulinum]HDK7206389.1 hypothetical protein [Clostridium botulinum]HDK7210125.1 hypothetical protein [Clostridium botulinum]HDK7265574.1 hypothetical protein [Clostridium botulinum]HDK7269422.1 hypothetical protein [Clostridium botulinum]